MRVKLAWEAGFKKGGVLTCPHVVLTGAKVYFCRSFNEMAGLFTDVLLAALIAEVVNLDQVEDHRYVPQYCE